MGLLDIGSFFTGLIINLLLISLICYYFKRKYENLEESLNEQAKILYELLERDKNTKEDTIEKLYNNVESLNDINSEVETEDDEDDDDDTDGSVNDNIENSLNNIDTTGVKFIDIENNVENTIVSSLDIKVLKEENEKNIELPVEQSETVYEVEQSNVVEQPDEVEQPDAVDEVEQPEAVDEVEQSIVVEQPTETSMTDEIKEDDVEIPDDEEEYETYDETNSDNNYNKMNVKELRNILSVKGVNVSSKMKKNELLSLIHGKKSLIIDMALEDN